MVHATKFTLAAGLLVLTFAMSAATHQNTIRSQEQFAQGTSQERQGEVDRLLDELKSRNETVATTCLHECDSQKRNQGITGGEFINRVMPEYPPIARAARASGHVAVLVIIDETGNVIAAQSISGHPLLQAAAVQAAKGSTFNPFLLGGVEVKVKGMITYHFVMESRLL